MTLTSVILNMDSHFAFPEDYLAFGSEGMVLESGVARKKVKS